MKAVISIAPYLTDKGEHTALFNINKNVHAKPKKEYITVMLLFLASPPTSARKECNKRRQNLKSFVMVLFVEVSLTTWEEGCQKRERVPLL